MIDNRSLIQNQQNGDLQLNELGEAAIQQSVYTRLETMIQKAKKEAYLINLILGFICISKITATTICFQTNDTSFSPLLLWVYLMLIYDITYLFHLIGATIAVARCSEEDLLYGDPEQEEISDTNLQSFIFQQFLLSCRPINGLKLQENAEKKFINNLRYGEFCRLFYMILFIYGNVIFCADAICSPDRDEIYYYLTVVYLIFGYIYLSIPLLLCLFWPFIAIYTYCSDIWSEVSQRPPVRQDNLNKLTIQCYKEIEKPVEKDCTICFMQYEPDDKLVVMPCNKLHYFHEECVKKWLESNGNCPMCRVYVDNAFEIENP
ncbi:hypothetical protein ABPG72_002942 [Tetrahymena utriculariae]